MSSLSCQNANPYTDNSFTSSDLKTILHSNVPISTTTIIAASCKKTGVCCILLKPRESLLQHPDCQHHLYIVGWGHQLPKLPCGCCRKAGYWSGFAAAVGTPFVYGNRNRMDDATSQNIARLNMYKAGYRGGGEDGKRLQAAKHIQFARLAFLQKHLESR